MSIATDSGSVQMDVQGLLRTSFAILRNPARGRVVASLMAQAQRDQQFAILFRDRFIKARREVLADLLQRGVARGDLAAETDIELLVDLIYGAMWYRLLTGHGPLDVTFADALVARTLR